MTPHCRKCYTRGVLPKRTSCRFGIAAKPDWLQNQLVFALLFTNFPFFDCALERYNSKQTREDRKISDYYEKIRSGKQEKPFHELILQIGDNESWFCYRSHFAIVNDGLLVFADKTPRSSANMGATTENGELAKTVLDEYFKNFQERNPSLRVFSAHLHMDEATPHLHIDFVPLTTDSKRGLDTRVSLKQALAALGFKGGTRGMTEWNQWVQ